MTGKLVEGVFEIAKPKGVKSAAITEVDLTDYVSMTLGGHVGNRKVKYCPIDRILAVRVAREARAKVHRVCI